MTRDAYDDHRPSLDAETLALLTDSVRRLVDEILIPAEPRLEQEGAVPEEIIQAMRDAGLFGLTAPQAYGGLGLNLSDEVRIVFELCRASPVYRSLIGTTLGVGGKSLVISGTDAQKARYLPRVAAGELIVSFCLTEPDSGSDAASLRTKAEKVPGGYVLNGTKRFISNAPDAGLFVVMARTDPESTGAGGVSAFLVDAGTEGLHVGPPLKKMGQDGTHTADVVFEDCRVPDDALLGEEEGTGFRTAMRVLDDGRVHMAAVCTGLSRRLIDEALGYALERRQFGKPIAEFQLIQGMLADSETDWLAARSMTEATARRRDEGQNITREASCAKYFATEALGRIADRAVQIHGGYGYVAEYPVERLYRDARLFRIFEGTSQIQQLVIAREMMRGVR
jgi:acyl-CoA dehydrogenase